ncbi:hypothetical protein DFR52_104192 [Hoeflea marina]|uniref:PRC-barrel domain protein n=1 Tax=Hoeflea marina TaxID=274592 RepID=A0A317PFC6_9HYPH|nr:hypothetical protein [Hoeflea marina]PWV98901.1 hypothetical protein DFR52_104192 [Hoeflea marina]
MNSITDTNMTKTATTISRSLIAAAFAITAFTATTQAARAFQIGAEAPATEQTVLAYAEPMNERFGPTVQSDEEEVDHELNDAWLGMTALSAEGEVLGYVSDAIVNSFGEVTDLVISPDMETEGRVFVPARLAVLGDEAVQLSLTNNDLAALETATTVAMANY